MSLIVVGFSQHGRVLDRALRSPVEYRAWHEEEAVPGTAGEVRDLDAAPAIAPLFAGSLEAPSDLNAPRL